MLVGEARQALKEEAPLDRLRSLTGDLQQLYQGLSAGSSGPSGTGGGAGPGPPGGDGTARPDSGDDDVIDAEFTGG
jgi:molecular chaperone DnaK